MTESTSTDTDGQARGAGTPRRRRGLLPGTWTELGAVVVALLAIVVTVFGVKFYNDDKGAGAVPGPDQQAGTATTAATTPATGPTTSPTSAPGRPVAELTRIGGVLTELPDELHAAKFPRAIVAECPSNQTGETARLLTYELDRRYRTFTATVSAWADTKEPDPILVRVSIRTEQPDGTFVTTEQAVLGRVVNGPAAPLSAKVKNANELVLSVECHRPHGVVILSDAQVHS